MRVIIAGSRDIIEYSLVYKAILDSGFTVTEVISGCASGVDSLGERYADSNQIPIRYFPADWRKYGKAAGPLRNQKMAEYADALIAIRKDMSRGTTDMINRARRLGLKIYVFDIQNKNTFLEDLI